MRRDAVLALCILMSAAASSGLAAPIPEAATPSQKQDARRALPVEGAITNPDWLTKPTGQDVATYYPHVAIFAGIEGRAIIHCLVTSGGTLADCSVTSESPKGMGFGSATLKLANLFRMKPMTVDGAPVSGGAINIPVNFQLPRDPAGPAEVSPTEPPSQKALALGRRLAKVVIQNLADDWKVRLDQWTATLDQLSPEEQTAIDLSRQSMTAEVAKAEENFAVLYAKAYSEAHLSQIVAFVESDAGRAWYARQNSISARFQLLSKNLQRAVSDDTAVRFCQQVACPPARAPVAPRTPAK